MRYLNHCRILNRSKKWADRFRSSFQSVQFEFDFSVISSNTGSRRVNQVFSSQIIAFLSGFV